MSTSAGAPVASGIDTTRGRLDRRFGRFGFFALAFGSMIGVGWVTAIGDWLVSAGPLGTVIGFLAGGLLMMCIGLCYAEVTPMLPVAGGEVAYAYAASGTRTAFAVGWLLAFGYISVSAFEAISVGRVVGFLFPGLDVVPLYAVAGAPVYLPHLLLAITFTVAMTVLHYTGVRWVAIVQTRLTVAFLVLVALFVVVGLANGSTTNAQPLMVGEGLPAIGGILAVLVTVPFWFVGFDTIPQGAEESAASVPPRMLGTLIVSSIVAAAAFYVLLVSSVAMVAPWRDIVASDLPAAAAFEAAFASTAWRDVILIAALIGLFTSWNGFFLAGSRVVFSLGRGRIIAPAFGVTHERFGTPHNAVLLTGAVTLLGPLLGRNALLFFVNVGSFCIAAAFLGVALSTRALRTKRPDLPRPYRMRSRAIPVVAAVGAAAMLLVMVVPGSPAALAWPEEVLVLGAFLGLGACFWLLAAPTRRAVDEERRSWLILEEYAGVPPARSEE